GLQWFWIERRRPQRHIGAVAQRYGHLAALAVDFDMAEELHAGGWRQVLLAGPRRLGKLHLGANGAVELVRPKRAGMQRPGAAFPERVEFLELRLVGIVV